MDLKVKDILLIILSLMVVFILGYVYVLTENYIFDQVLSDYIPETAVFIIRIIHTVMMIKLACDASKIIMVGVRDAELQRLKATTEAENQAEMNQQKKQV